MRTLHLILYILSAICFAAALALPDPVRTADAGVGVTVTPTVTRRLQLIAAGLLLWVLNPLASLINDMVND